MDMLTSLGINKDLIADFIINIGSIIVLFLIVKKLAYKPIKKFMDERTERVNSVRINAEAREKEAQEKINKYNVLLEESEKAKAKAVKEGEKQALEESKLIVSEAKDKAKVIVDNANKKAKEKYDSTIEEANDYIVNLTIEASSHLLKRELTDEDNKKIVKDFLESVGDKNA